MCLLSLRLAVCTIRRSPLFAGKLVVHKDPFSTLSSTIATTTDASVHAQTHSALSHLVQNAFVYLPLLGVAFITRLRFLIAFAFISAQFCRSVFSAFSLRPLFFVRWLIPCHTFVAKFLVFFHQFDRLVYGDFSWFCF